MNPLVQGKLDTKDGLGSSVHEEDRGGVEVASPLSYVASFIITFIYVSDQYSVFRYSIERVKRDGWRRIRDPG